LVALLFVDDTDILHTDICEDQSVEEAHYSLHESIHNWGKLLMATGGAFKSPKCFDYMISYVWEKDKRRAFEDNEKNEELNITVPLSDGLEAPVEHLSAGYTRENPGGVHVSIRRGKETNHKHEKQITGVD
jgi:hypothetical protein